MGKKPNFTDKETKMMKDMDALSAQAQADPKIRGVSAPDSLWYELKRDIREYESEQKVKKQEQRNQELIKLGLVYERRRRFRKYYVLAAAFVLALAFGITSFGDGEKLFNMIKGDANGREQMNVNSDDAVKVVTRNNEELVYEEIEDKFGFYPVKLDYLPEGIGFQESIIGDEILGIQMLYGKTDKLYLEYFIRPNFRNGSWGQDIEDELLETYLVEIEDVPIHIEEYKINDGTSRWSIRYEYNDVGYSIVIDEFEYPEIEKIVNNLYFRTDEER